MRDIDLKRRRETLLQHLQTSLAERKCMKCSQPVEQYQKVYKCVYADPCGHRQYQGQLPREQAQL